MGFFNDKRPEQPKIDVLAEQLRVSLLYAQAEGELQDGMKKFMQAIKPVLELAFPYDEEERYRVKKIISKNLEIIADIHAKYGHWKKEAEDVVAKLGIQPKE